MANGFGLLEHRLVRLVVAAAVHRVWQPADVQVVLGQIEMLPVPSDAIQLDAVERVALSAGERRVLRLELRIQRVSRADRVVEQFPSSRGPEPGRCHFESLVAAGRP